MRRQLLVVEDDAALARVLCDSLTAEGFDVSWATSGPMAARRFEADRPDLVVVDAASPGLDAAARAWRSRGRTPLLLLTARRVGDDAGWPGVPADDCLCKPFRIDDLVARIRARLRAASSAVRRVTFGSIVVDFGARRADSPNRPVNLTRREFDLLQYLAEREPETVALGELLREVWGCREPALLSVAERAVARLRLKIEPDAARPRYLLGDASGCRLATTSSWRSLTGGLA